MNPKVRENVKKRRKDDFVDDGRVIADMSIDGMPGTISRRRRKPPVPFGTCLLYTSPRIAMMRP